MPRLGLLFLFILTVISAIDALVIPDVKSAARSSLPADRSLEPDDIPFVTVDAGTSSGIKTREKYIIRDDAQWLSMWQQHTANSYPAPPAPHVDFGSEMVVAVFAGENHKPGSLIQIDSIKKADNRIYILVSEPSAGGGSGREPNPFSDSEPYFIARMAQSSLPITFQGL